MHQFATFLSVFLKATTSGIIFKCILIVYGHVKDTPVILVIQAMHYGYALCMSSENNIANYIVKTRKLAC